VLRVIYPRTPLGLDLRGAEIALGRARAAAGTICRRRIIGCLRGAGAAARIVLFVRKEPPFFVNALRPPADNTNDNLILLRLKRR